MRRVTSVICLLIALITQYLRSFCAHCESSGPMLNLSRNSFEHTTRSFSFIGALYFRKLYLLRRAVSILRFIETYPFINYLNFHQPALVFAQLNHTRIRGTMRAKHFVYLLKQSRVCNLHAAYVSVLTLLCVRNIVATHWKCHGLAQQTNSSLAFE